MSTMRAMIVRRIRRRRRFGSLRIASAIGDRVGGADVQLSTLQRYAAALGLVLELRLTSAGAQRGRGVRRKTAGGLRHARGSR